MLEIPRLPEIVDRLRNIFKRSQDESIQIDNQMDYLQEILLRYQLLSTSVSMSRSGELDKKSRTKSLIVILLQGLSFGRRVLVVLFTGSFVLDPNRSLGHLVSFSLGILILNGGTSTVADRILYFWAERRQLLHHVYHLYPKDGLQSQFQGFKTEECQSFNRMLRYAIRGLAITIRLSILLWRIILIGLFIFSNIQEASLLFTLFSFVFLIIDLIGIHWAVTTLIPNYFLMALSTKLLIMKIGNIRYRIVSSLYSQEPWKVLYNQRKIRREVIEIFDMIHQQNILKQYFFGNTMLLVNPAISFCIYLVTTDAPVWLLLGIWGEALPIILLIMLSMYYNGRVFTKSLSLLNPMYSMQTQMKFPGRNGYVFSSRTRSMIKLIFSRKPLGFTLPDGTLLSPMTTVQFAVSTVSITILLLNNNII